MAGLTCVGVSSQDFLSRPAFLSALIGTRASGPEQEIVHFFP